MIDNLGQPVSCYGISEITRGYRISFANLPQGCYTLRLRFADQVVTRKFIKEYN